MTAPRVRAVVVTWNGAHLLGPCLASLAAQDVPPGTLEVLVVDNASTDGTAELLAREHPDVTVLHSPDNLGFAGGAALGTAAFAGEHLLLLNNDATLDPDALGRMLAVLDTHPRVGAVTAKILLDGWYREATPQEAASDGAAFRTAATAFVPTEADDPRAVRLVNSTGNVVNRWGAGGDRDWLAVDGTESTDPEVFGFSGGAALLRRTALEEVGGFDPWLFLYYEDTDVAWKMRRRGWSVRYEAAAVARHRHAASSDAASPLFRYQNTRNSLVVAVRHAPWVMVLAALARQSLGWIASAARRREPAPIRAARGRGLRDALRRMRLSLRERRQFRGGLLAREGTNRTAA